MPQFVHLYNGITICEAHSPGYPGAGWLVSPLGPGGQGQKAAETPGQRSRRLKAGSPSPRHPPSLWDSNSLDQPPTPSGHQKSPILGWGGGLAWLPCSLGRRQGHLRGDSGRTRESRTQRAVSCGCPLPARPHLPRPVIHVRINTGSKNTHGRLERCRLWLLYTATAHRTAAKR